MPPKPKDYVREARFTVLIERVLRHKAVGDVISYDEMRPHIEADSPCVYSSRIRAYVLKQFSREIRNIRGKGWVIADGAMHLKIGDTHRKNATHTLARALRAYMGIQPDELDETDSRRRDHAIARTATELHGLKESNRAIKRLKNTVLQLPRPR